MEKQNILNIQNIHKSYKMGKNVVSVLKGMSFDIAEGEWVAMLGASGSGKTTMMNIIGTLERPEQGKVFYNEKSYTDFSRKEIVQFRNQKIGFIFQTYHLLPELTVLENVLIPANFAKQNSSDAKQKAIELIERVGLSHRITHRPSELSGGEQQRAAIARALINSPEIILADEPTGNLDTHTGEEILDLLNELRNEKSVKTIIMVTHDQKIAKLADRTITLDDGIVIN